MSRTPQPASARTAMPSRERIPYITNWSSERHPRTKIVTRGQCGIAYPRERPGDRDGRGVLWIRTIQSPGQGVPQYRLVHPRRQRRAMHRLLCQVCGGPADRNGLGTLWLIGEAEQGWSDDEVTGHPPVCLRCALPASRACPHLRRGTLALRARHAPIAGVTGRLHAPGPSGLMYSPETVTVSYDDPRVRWMQAHQLMRKLHGCTVVDLAEEAARARMRHGAEAPAT